MRNFLNRIMQGCAMNKILKIVMFVTVASFGQELERNRINSKDQVMLPLIINLTSTICEKIVTSEYSCMPIEIADFLSDSQKTNITACGNVERKSSVKFEFIPFERINKGVCSPLIFYVKQRANDKILFLQGVMMKLRTSGDSLTIIEMKGHVDYFFDK